MNLFAGKPWRNKHKEQSYGQRGWVGKRVRCVERVTWKLTISYVKYPMVIDCKTQETQIGAL